jgi:hypothetical protein
MNDAARAMSAVRKLYRAATKAEDIARYRKEMQTVAADTLKADTANALDRTRFRALRQAEEFKAETDSDKRGRILVNRLDDLTR